MWTATVVGALVSREEKESEELKTKKKKVRYLQRSSGVYPISGQAGKWGRESHEKCRQYGAEA